VDASEILRLSLLDDGGNPEPADHDAEVETARAIIDFCEQSDSPVTRESLEPFAPATPWIAWQLAMFAERELAEQRGTLAIRVATAAVIAAEMCRSVEFIYRNLLTCGNILLELGAHVQALDLYSTLLRLPFTGGVSARAGAHIAMGTIYRYLEVDLRASIYHYEHAMRFVGPRNKQATVVQFWEGLLPLYKDANDEIGLVLCACQMHFPKAKELMKEIVAGSLERKIALRSRLLRQGNSEMADVVKTM
jgi:hypothetical protein